MPWPTELYRPGRRHPDPDRRHLGDPGRGGDLRADRPDDAGDRGSSEADDHGLKWLSYRKIESLKHYLVIAQDRRLVHIHSRAGGLWRERFLSTGAIELDDPPVRLDIDAVYATTEVAA